MCNRIIINIGRQFGSGGKEVADKLGEILGIKVYDSELLIKAAEESGFSKDLFIQSDEKKNFWSISSIFATNRYVRVNNSFINDNEFFKIQSKVINDIAEKESAIFVGRASNYILRAQKCLDVFISAPMKYRVERVSQRMGLTLDDAESVIRKKDREREAFYNFYTFGNWGVASTYDLCIDSSILGIDGTAEFIIDFLNKQK